MVALRQPEAKLDGMVGSGLYILTAPRTFATDKACGVDGSIQW
jgi:hypothetical protein